MGKFKSIYNTARWKRVRELVLRSRPVCECCHEHPATDVDHIVPIRDGVDPYDQSNLQALCHRCHSMKTVGGERLQGCDADGFPLDARHPWATPKEERKAPDILGGFGF